MMRDNARHADPAGKLSLYSVPKRLASTGPASRRESVGASNRARSPNQQPSARSTSTGYRGVPTATAQSRGRSEAEVRAQVRARMSKAPDIAPVRGGNINVYQVTPAYVSDFWTKLKRDSEELKQRKASLSNNPSPTRVQSDEPPADTKPAPQSANGQGAARRPLAARTTPSRATPSPAPRMNGKTAESARAKEEPPKVKPLPARRTPSQLATPKGAPNSQPSTPGKSVGKTPAKTPSKTPSKAPSSARPLSSRKPKPMTPATKTGVTRSASQQPALNTPKPNAPLQQGTTPYQRSKSAGADFGRSVSVGGRDAFARPPTLVARKVVVGQRRSVAQAQPVAAKA